MVSFDFKLHAAQISFSHLTYEGITITLIPIPNRMNSSFCLVLVSKISHNSKMLSLFDSEIDLMFSFIKLNVFLEVYF